MPELPEVETVANGAYDRTHGQRILSAEFSRAREHFKTAPNTMTTSSQGKLRLHSMAP